MTGTAQQLLQNEVRPLVAHFLPERGLELSHEKTTITRVEIEDKGREADAVLARLRSLIAAQR